MLKKLIIAFFCPLLAFGALPTNSTVWELRTVGSDTNGGAFVTGASGTDMSQFDNKNAAACVGCQSATVNISATDAVANGTTTITSNTMNGSAAIVGNVIFLSGGTGTLSPGWYEVVTFVSNIAGTTTFTVDRNVAAGTGITMNIGGALATFQQMSTNVSLAAGSGAWVKATASYDFSTTVDLLNGATNTGQAFINGYTTTRGDNGKPTLLALAGLAGGNSYILRWNGSPEGSTLANFILDCDNRNFTRGFNYNTAQETLRNITVQNCSDQAFVWNQIGACYECTTINVPSATAASSGFSAYLSNNVEVTCVNCSALGTTAAGGIAFQSMCQGLFVNTILANFSGATTDAWTCTTQEGILTVLNASIYGFTRDAFRFAENVTNDLRPILIRNSVISNIGGFCFNSVGTLTFTQPNHSVDHNGCNTTGASGFYNNWGSGTNDVTLSVNPFTNPAGNDFSLNSTAGGGAAVKGAGFPGIVSGGTGHMDMGALQSAGGGGGGGTSGSVVFP